MFCKWCGGNVASTDTKCKRCGRDVPALSDCGGFYDLVPGAKKVADVRPEPTVLPGKPEMPSVSPKSMKATEPAKTNKNVSMMILGSAALIVLGFVLVILMLVNVNGTIEQYTGEVYALRDELQIVSGKIDSLVVAMEATEPEVTEPEETEPEVVVIPVLDEQNVSFVVKIAEKNSEQEIQADLDLGDYVDTAIISYDMDALTDTVKNVKCMLKEADAAVLLTIEHHDEQNIKNLWVSYVIDDIAYGISVTSETCQWQYRCGKDAAWEDLLTDAFDQANEDGMTGVSIKDDSLEELIDNNGGELELRCEISRTNTKNGTLTIVIEGIRFCEAEDNAIATVG